MCKDKGLIELEDNYPGFNNTSIQDILDYLFDRFGEVTPTELEKARSDLSKPFESCDLFSAVIFRMKMLWALQKQPSALLPHSKLLARF